MNANERVPDEGPFGGEGAEEYNALHRALRKAAHNYGHTGEYAVYQWIEEVPQTSLAVELVNALHECGYTLTRRSDHAD